MDLGSKIKAARLAAGLSQRQLCGDGLTRNMLSQIENGSARPSMKTLTWLAGRLEKPVSYFLEEQAVTSPNQQTVTDARTALALEDLEGLRQALDHYREPDEVFYEERQLLEFLWHQKQAEQALRQGRLPYAVKLLEKAQALGGLYITRQMRRSVQVLLGLAGEPSSVESDDLALLARARQTADPQRKLEILAAAEDRQSPQWNLAQAQALQALARYAEARVCYEKADQTSEVLAGLELCCRELGDFKAAYEYACRQREEK